MAPRVRPARCLVGSLIGWLFLATLLALAPRPAAAQELNVGIDLQRSADGAAEQACAPGASLECCEAAHRTQELMGKIAQAIGQAHLPPDLQKPIFELGIALTDTLLSATATPAVASACNVMPGPAAKAVPDALGGSDVVGAVAQAKAEAEAMKAVVQVLHDEAPSAPPADASEPPDRGLVSLHVENDTWGGSDSHYTNGLRLAAAFLTHWGWLEQRSWAPRTLYLGGAFGQNMYSPDLINPCHSKGLTDPRDCAEEEQRWLREDFPRDRPFSGWLYLAGTAAAAWDRPAFWGGPSSLLGWAELQVGCAGGCSGAEWVQRHWHRIVGAPDPRGWDLGGTVTANHFGANLGLGLEYPAVDLRSAGGWGARLGLTGAAWAGSVFDNLGLGLTLRVGYRPWAGLNDTGIPLGAKRLPEAKGPAAATARDCGCSHFAAYLLGQAEARFDLYNRLFDNQLGDDRPQADRHPQELDLLAGAVVRVGPLEPSAVYLVRREELNHSPAGRKWHRVLQLRLSFVY